MFESDDDYSEAPASGDGLALRPEFQKKQEFRKVGEKELSATVKTKSRLAAALAFVADETAARKQAYEARKQAYMPVAQSVSAVAQSAASGSNANELAAATDRLAEASLASDARVAVLEKTSRMSKAALKGLVHNAMETSGNIANIVHTLMRAGVVDSGDMTANLRAGKIFIGQGNGIDVKGTLISLAMLRTAQLVERRGTAAGESGASAYDRFYDKDPEATMIVMERGFCLYIDKATPDQNGSIVFSGIEARYEVRGDESHVWMPGTFGAPKTLAGLAAFKGCSGWEEFSKVYPKVVKGDIIKIPLPSTTFSVTLPAGLTEEQYVAAIVSELSASLPRVARWNAVRATHDLGALATLAGLLGLQSATDSAILNLLPIATETISGVFRKFTGADTKSIDSLIRSVG